MTNWLRRAGRGLLPDGATLLWSLAEGRRGRRWRSTTLTEDGIVELDMTLEVDTSGLFTRLELTRSNGMLTLHPAVDGSRVDGNVVTRDGVRPISCPWSGRHELHVAGSPIPEFATALGRVRQHAPVQVVSIDAELALSTRLSVPGEGSAGLSDARGVPTLTASTEWALEE